MNNVSDAGTRESLLGRLRSDPSNAEAWEEFVDLYGRKIHAWCRAWNLQDSDSLDVTQDVLLNLATKLRDFHYNPDQSFRAWLKTLTFNAWQNHLKSQKRHGRGSGDDASNDRLDHVEAPADLARRLEEAFDQELFEEASARVRLRIEPRTWEAFRLMTLEDQSGAEVAQHLGMKVAAVFVARSRVLRLLRDEVAKMEQPHC